MGLNSSWPGVFTVLAAHNSQLLNGKTELGIVQVDTAGAACELCGRLCGTGPTSRYRSAASKLPVLLLLHCPCSRQ